MLDFIPWVLGIADTLFNIRLYYQHKAGRLSTCPLTIHALLHIPDSIEYAGPVWTSWAFPMERFCGRLLPAFKSRRHPWPNVDNYVVASCQLSQIKLKYGLADELSLKPLPRDIPEGSFSHRGCKISSKLRK